jgi:hypothetical protein
MVDKLPCCGKDFVDEQKHGLLGRELNPFANYIHKLCNCGHEKTSYSSSLSMIKNQVKEISKKDEHHCFRPAKSCYNTC